MSNNPENCLFRQLQQNPDVIPESMTPALATLSKVEDESATAADVAEAMLP